ncbi:MAG: hypothetical protein WCN95_16680 [bacterium]
MTTLQKRLTILCIYVGLCLVFWLPYLRAFVTHLPTMSGSPLWTVLFIPSVPLAICFLRFPMWDGLTLMLQPVYTALILWPLLAVAVKPSLWKQDKWQFVIVLYSIVFAIIMVASAVMVVAILRMRSL